MRSHRLVSFWDSFSGFSRMSFIHWQETQGFLAADVKGAPLEREPAVHVLEHVLREAAQRAVVFSAVPETLREPVIIRGAVGPVRSILVPGT